MSDRQRPSGQGEEEGARPRSPLLDWAYLDTCLQHGIPEARLLQMVDLFERRFAEDRLHLLEALEAADLARVRASAHRLKGSSGSIGLATLRSRAAAIEAAAKGGDPAACQSALEGFQEVGAASIQAFRDHLRTHAPQ
ncbi:Hpt domain-containing protein [Geothrix terrae]|uniref:Hpt domain-containing protein n=1 Tax=Geothrix terrae TaxID=2922720 RepID=UPI001FAC6D66|nr:Hpt domain-containing protein [Geothrix terrae]